MHGQKKRARLDHTHAMRRVAVVGGGAATTSQRLGRPRIQIRGFKLPSGLH